MTKASSEKAAASRLAGCTYAPRTRELGVRHGTVAARSAYLQLSLVPLSQIVLCGHTTRVHSSFLPLAYIHAVVMRAKQKGA